MWTANEIHRIVERILFGFDVPAREFSGNSLRIFCKFQGIRIQNFRILWNYLDLILSVAYFKK